VNRFVDPALASQHPLARSISVHAHAYPRSSAIIHADACALAHAPDASTDSSRTVVVPVVPVAVVAPSTLGNSRARADVANATTRHTTAARRVACVVVARVVARDIRRGAE